MPWQESGACSFAVDAGVVQALTSGRLYELRVQAQDEGAEWWLPAVKLLVRPDGDALALEGLQWEAR